jgi:hypothetical protein
MIFEFVCGHWTAHFASEDWLEATKSGPGLSHRHAQYECGFLRAPTNAKSNMSILIWL